MVKVYEKKLIMELQNVCLKLENLIQAALSQATTHKNQPLNLLNWLKRASGHLLSRSQHFFWAEKSGKILWKVAGENDNWAWREGSIAHMNLWLFECHKHQRGMKENVKIVFIFCVLEKCHFSEFSRIRTTEKKSCEMIFRTENISLASFEDALRVFPVWFKLVEETKVKFFSFWLKKLIWGTWCNRNNWTEFN